MYLDKSTHTVCIERNIGLLIWAFVVTLFSRPHNIRFWIHLGSMSVILTYLLHGAESFLRSQPVNFAASQEIPRIYGIRRFLTVPTSVRHLSLSFACEIRVLIPLKSYHCRPQERRTTGRPKKRWREQLYIWRRNGSKGPILDVYDDEIRVLKKRYTPITYTSYCILKYLH
jgi:hypothetical protein